MPHPEVRNHSRFASQVAMLADEEGRPLIVPILQAVFAIGKDGALALIDPQPEIDLPGGHWGDPAASSWRMEPQTAFCKPGCDVVLLGHAIATRPGTAHLLMTLRAGPLERSALVFGDRWMLRGRRITDPEPFDRIPLHYERAFGGWDRRDADPNRHRVEARNPVGLGFRYPALAVDAEVRLPNIENPECPIRNYGEAPAPVGFGFVSPQWQPRASLAGTYDAAWMQTRMPLLPKDFDRRFFNAASAGLVGKQALAGNDPISVVGATPSGRLDFKLPDAGIPLFNVGLRGRKRQSLKLALDTVIVDTDKCRLTLIWRAHLALVNGPHDLVEAAFHLPDAKARQFRLKTAKS